MSINRPFEDLATQLPRPSGPSRPRCVCHNKYMTECPGTAKPKPAAPERIAIHRKIPAKAYGCTKTKHRTRGKAEAQLRSMIRRRELGIMPPDKKELPLIVYKCMWLSCREEPYHVGHDYRAQAQPQEVTQGDEG